MNKIYLSVVLIAATVATVVGQQTAPQTRRRAAASPFQGKTETWTLFAPEGGGFQVLLPGKPVKTVRAADAASGKLERISYQLDSVFSVYLIQHFDYPAAITNREEKLRIYNEVYDDLAKNP